MSTLEQRITPIANLLAQLHELSQLREQVEKAELARDRCGSGAEKEGSIGASRRR